MPGRFPVAAGRGWRPYAIALTTRRLSLYWGKLLAKPAGHFNVLPGTSSQRCSASCIRPAGGTYVWHKTRRVGRQLMIVTFTCCILDVLRTAGIVHHVVLQFSGSLSS